MSPPPAPYQYSFEVSLCREESIPATRPCSYELSLQGGSVFADFVIVDDQEGRSTLQLVRISFDGYGCCRCNGEALLMNSADAETLMNLFPSLPDSEQEVANILGRFFETVKGPVWEDALSDHELIRPQ